MSNINYSIDTNNVLRVYSGNVILFEVQDVKNNSQALQIIDEGLGE